MTVREIYTKIATQMLKGIMIHQDLANYYDFLGLKGYKRCHEYHFLCETLNYRSLNRYFINHHNMLISVDITQSAVSPVIPDSWYNHTRQDVDATTKRNAIKSGLDMWVTWERETKKLYEQMYKELLDIDEIASANKVCEFICDIDRELKKVERYQLNKESTGYDMSDIIHEQEKKHRKYKHKCQSELRITIC